VTSTLAREPVATVGADKQWPVRTGHGGNAEVVFRSREEAHIDGADMVPRASDADQEPPSTAAWSAARSTSAHLLPYVERVFCLKDP
jgi:hypothetical protein